MRPTLYFKDDDSRLSFLNGNYITMTNMKDKDIDRIVRFHMSPMNVSVHTTDPELRVRMLKNPRAALIMDQMRVFYNARIVMNGQIVLCRGINDGAALERTLTDLMEFVPMMQSLSIVPVGLTKYREGLYPLEPFTREDARALIRQVEPWRQKCYEKFGLHFVHLADEFYILAEEPIPPEEAYDGYLQIENGVGMMRLFLDEAEEAIAAIPADAKGNGTVSVVTAQCAYPFIQDIADRIGARVPGGKVQVFCIRNDFFGEHITVTGLLTGRDILNQLRGKDLGDLILLPGNLLRADAPILLDDVTVDDLKEALQTEIDSVQSSGRDFVHQIVTCLMKER
jgi:putative radical SAM enzyme (TIGR03279 family)